MKSLNFTENSNLINIGIIISLLPVCAVMAYLLWQLTKETTIAGIVFNIAVFTIITISIVLLFSIKLTLNVNQEFIEIKYFPFKTVIVNKNDIVFCEINMINSISEFGGWGLKKSKRYGKGYTTKGDLILTIKKQNGELISVSIFNREQLKNVLINNGYNFKD